MIERWWIALWGPNYAGPMAFTVWMLSLFIVLGLTFLVINLFIDS